MAHVEVPGTRLNLGWLFTVARHIVIDWKKANRPSVVSQVTLEHEATSREIAPGRAAETIDEMQKFFAWLDADDRDLLERVYISGQAVADAGAAIGLEPEAAWKRHRRALATIRDMIAQHGEARLPRMDQSSKQD
jgi:DNA-directed RNA polymerase specialized sigma24 family protein